MIDRNHDRTMTPQSAGDDWQACPKGLLTDAAQGECRRVSRRRMLRTVGTAAAVLASAGLGGLVWRFSTTSPADGVATTEPSAEIPLICDECQKLLPDLLHDHVTATMRLRMERHFVKCRHCRDEWTKLKEGRA